MQARLAHFFKTARRKAGIRQQELADLLQCSLSAIERFESTSRTENTLINSILTIQKYAPPDCSATDLVSYVEGKEAPLKDVLLQKAVDKISQLDVESQADVIALLEQKNIDLLIVGIKIANIKQKLQKSRSYRDICELFKLFGE